MEKSINTPSEAAGINLEASVGKAMLPMGKMILMGLMAGGFIGLGAAASSTAVHGVADVGMARLLAGLIFPVGLMMIVMAGGELFTGNSLMVMGVLDKRFTMGRLLRNLTAVYLCNLAGSVLTAVLVVYSGNLDYSSGLLGAYTIKTALAKASIAPVKGIVSGILCNVLVCMAILMAAAAREAAGKLLAVFFPICAFVVAGFEHCVANMYYIPAGILAARNPVYTARAQEAYGITAAQLADLSLWGVVRNLIPVTVGNLIGGMLFVGLPVYFISIKCGKKPERV